MKVATVNISTVLDDSNERECLSAHRVLSQCYKCNLYKNCESKIVNPRYDELVGKRLELYREADNISEEIEEL